MPLTRFGLLISPSYPDVAPKDLFTHMRDVARAAEQSGFDSLWVPDHVMQSDIGGGRPGQMPEAYTMLGALAATTERARLGALVTPITLRNPALLAKMVAALDVISAGRAFLGLGAGWDGEEFDAYGIGFPAAREREDRLEESARICRAMLTEESASFEGSYYSIDTAWNVPRPIQASVPILIGGGGERRTLRIVAEHADACNIGGEPAVLRHKLEVLEQHCEAVGRNFAEITKTCMLTPPGSTAELCDAVGERLAVGMEGFLMLGRAAPEQVQTWGAALMSTFS